MQAGGSSRCGCNLFPVLRDRFVLCRCPPSWGWNVGRSRLSSRYLRRSDWLARANNGLFFEFGIHYRQFDLNSRRKWSALGQAIEDTTRLVLTSSWWLLFWRSSLSIADIERFRPLLNSKTRTPPCFVDNCYGEFIEDREPTAVGAIYLQDRW